MNKYKQSIFSQLRKKMSKAIKTARSTLLSNEAVKDQDALTAKELNKKFPKKRSRKLEQKTAALQRKKAHHLKENLGSSLSKRTTPGLTEAEAAPAYCHKEGARWIKTLSKQTKNQRVVAAHHGKSHSR